jgi:nucleotide sugar dehydrogenase
MDAAVASIAPGVHAGSLVVFETTLPVGDTRHRFAPRLEQASGLRADDDFFVAFSPERLYSGAALRNLATYPKLVGGIGAASTDRAARFYASVLDTEVVAMSSAEAAEFSKLADTTYRDVNIALANEFARYADRVGVDVQEVIAAANSQPYSHIHQPGLGVGGHCIPVYPHFLLSRAPEMELVALSRRVNDGQVGVAIRAIQKELGGLEEIPVLVLGLTYRSGVKELAYTRALPLIERLAFHGAHVSAYDPLLGDDEIARTGATPYRWGERSDARAIVTQTADPLFAGLDFGLFPDLEILLDGRNSLRAVVLPDRVAYQVSAYPGPAEGGLDSRAIGTPLIDGPGCESSASSGLDPSSSRRPRCCPRCALVTGRSSSTPASTTTRRWPAPSSGSSACHAPITPSAWGAGPRPSRPRGCWPAWSRSCWPSDRRPSSCTATRIPRSPSPSPPRSSGSRSPMSRRGCAASIDGCPRR